MPIFRVTRRGFTIVGGLSGTIQASPSPAAQEESDKLHFAVGDALSSWSGVDLELAHFLHLCLGARDFSITLAAQNKIISFRARLNVVHAAATAFFDLWLKDTANANLISPLQDRWKTAVKEIRASSEKRNELAHREVAIFYDGPNSDGQQTTCTAMLHFPESHPSAPRTYEGALANGLRLQEIERLADEFHQRAVSLGSLREETAQLLARLTASHAQQANPPQA